MFHRIFLEHKTDFGNVVPALTQMKCVEFSPAHLLVSLKMIVLNELPIYAHGVDANDKLLDI